MQKALEHMSYAELQELDEKISRTKATKKGGRSSKAVSDNITRRMKIGGGKVVDGLKPIEIRITKDDVRAGALKSASACAAARALCREGFTEARVHAGRTYVKQKDGTWLRYQTTPALRSEIVAFDRGGKFEPGTYRLTPIQPSQSIGARAKRKGYNYTKKSSSGPKRKNHVTTGIRSRFLPD